MHVKKKARSRANSDDEVSIHSANNVTPHAARTAARPQSIAQCVRMLTPPCQDESYARPTALYSPDPTPYDYPMSYPRAGHPGERAPAPASNPNAFSALSSVAMGELYALERDEAARRAEYEVRRREALRRAEDEARLMSGHSRLSKSATATPLSTPFFSAHFPANEESGYFGVSRERDTALGDEDVVKHPRRRSMGSSKRDFLSMHPHASGHVVDGNHSHARHAPPHAHHSHGHSMWAHPYNHPAAHRPHLHPAHDDSPSPISSDSDSMHPVQSPGRVSSATAHHQPSADHPQYAPGSRTPGGTEFAFTPSTSPFLGGLRTLNIHSSGPSRAPSPFRLPPPGMDSPVEEYGFYDSRARKISVAGSPPSTSVMSGRMAKRSSSGDLVAYGVAHGIPVDHFSMPPPSFHIPYSNDRSSTTSLPTPQLSSGPSSSGSSPRSRTQSIHAADASSASSSRAPSPPHHSRTSSHHHHHHHHAHLAHSVRAAFGMTPIHPRSRAPPAHAEKPLSPTSSTFSGAEREREGAPAATASSSSMPASRAASPPIKLAPLKLLSSPSSPLNRPDTIADKEARRRSLDGAVSEMSLREPAETKAKVELPGFSEFTAASGLGA